MKMKLKHQTDLTLPSLIIKGFFLGLFLFFKKKRLVGRHARGRTSLSSNTTKHDIKHKVTEHKLCLVKIHGLFEYWMLAAMPITAALKLSGCDYNV